VNHATAGAITSDCIPNQAKGARCPANGADHPIAFRDAAVVGDGNEGPDLRGPIRGRRIYDFDAKII